MNGRCKSKFVNGRGSTLQCEGIDGHEAVHYCGDVWWPNKKGFPILLGGRRIESVGVLVILGWLLAAAAFGALIFWLVTRS